MKPWTSGRTPGDRRRARPARASAWATWSRCSRTAAWTISTTQLVTFMQDLEQVRNRLPLADHRIIADAERRDLPQRLTQGTMVRTLLSSLRLSPGEASRRVRAAAAVGERVSMLGQPLTPVPSHRPPPNGRRRHARAGGDHRTGPGKVDHRGFDPATRSRARNVHRVRDTGPKQLRILADQVVDGIDPDGTVPTRAQRRSATSSPPATLTAPGR